MIERSPGSLTSTIFPSQNRRARPLTRAPTRRTLPRFTAVYIQSVLAALLVASVLVIGDTETARAQVRAFKLKQGRISQQVVDRGPQLARMIRVDANGQEVGAPFDVLIQHRAGPESQAIDDRWIQADSLITCFPASLKDPAVRRKAILNGKKGAIKIRRYADGIVIVEPVGA